MRIEYELKDVKIVRHDTIAAALIPLYGKRPYERQRVDNVSGLMTGERHVPNPHFAILHEPLAREYEGDRVYMRTCALVMLAKEWSVRDLYIALQGEDYFPAGTSETAAYLFAMRSHGAVAGSIVHLGTRILDEQYREYRLLTREDGRTDLIPLYAATKLKPYHRLVVVKKEVIAPKATFWRRKK